MNSKRGAILGPGMGLIWITALIIIVLFVFALGSAVVREIDESAGSVNVYTEGDLGLDNVINYMGSYAQLVRERVSLSEGVLYEE